jgi:phosphoribosylaminoimidazole-succinocarboxamide synthase
MTAISTVSEAAIPELRLLHRGKVRDVYEIDDQRLLLVATDRLSAFDCVLPTPILHKGAVLTQLSAFWFALLGTEIDNHLISVDLDDMPPELHAREDLRGRTTLVRRTTVFPVECVVRGYLEGSGLKEYQTTGAICGHQLPAGLRQCDKLPEPIFTPATKAASGHDENITYEQFAAIVGDDAAALLRSRSMQIYDKASTYARERGIIIADTKFEFGTDASGNVLLIDEVLTPDSSRFWAAETYEPGHAQPSFDKQFVREYLETLDWDKRPPAPPLPASVAAATADRYLKAFSLITGRDLIKEPAITADP